MRNYRATQYESQKKHKTRWEFLILILLVVIAGSSLLFIPASQTESEGSLSWIFPPEHRNSIGKMLANMGLPNPFVERKVPEGYELKGEIGEQYQVAVDPESGEMIIHDSFGGIGTNTTSVEGSRRKLAEGMVEMEEYAKQNCDALSKAECYWLHDVAKKGIQLAFGAPGHSAGAQSQMKKEMLRKFYEASLHAPQSLLSNDKYLDFQKNFEEPHDAYLADLGGQGHPLTPDNLLGMDPVYSPSRTLEPYLVQSQPTYNFTGGGGLYYPADPTSATLSTNQTTLATAPTTSNTLDPTFSLTGSTTSTPTTETGSVDALLSCTIGGGTCTSTAPTTSTTTQSPTYTTTTSPTYTTTQSPTYTTSPTISPTTTTATLSPTLSPTSGTTTLSPTTTTSPTTTSTSPTLSPTTTLTTSPTATLSPTATQPTPTTSPTMLQTAVPIQ